MWQKERIVVPATEAGTTIVAKKKEYWFQPPKLGPLLWQKEKIVVPATEAKTTIVAKKKE
ncbi:hypothetical protein [Bacillus sp. AG4(2022)]|uniref:hypothetical protein n=1 Tax=Bacillus sp. AG4(2022) TaxID=2962594 RepID=UPI00288240C0|nr:hypothetical protein [Bacillus sp. AG4(2022)]MDT0160124.1 hypothetical protein [Bacillus sp. AG4(2022)]